MRLPLRLRITPLMRLLLRRACEHDHVREDCRLLAREAAAFVHDECGGVTVAVLRACSLHSCWRDAAPSLAALLRGSDFSFNDASGDTCAENGEDGLPVRARRLASLAAARAVASNREYMRLTGVSQNPGLILSRKGAAVPPLSDVKMAMLIFNMFLTCAAVFVGILVVGRDLALLPKILLCLLSSLVLLVAELYFIYRKLV